MKIRCRNTIETIKIIRPCSFRVWYSNVFCKCLDARCYQRRDGGFKRVPYAFKTMEVTSKSDFTCAPTEIDAFKLRSAWNRKTRPMMIVPVMITA